MVLLHGSGGKVNQCFPQGGEGRVAEEFEEFRLVIVNHRFQDHEVSDGDFGGRGVDDVRQRLPVFDVGIRVVHSRLFVIAQRDGGETGAEARHAFLVAVLGHPWAVLLLAPPSDPGFALRRGLVAVDPPEDRAYDVHFRDEDIDQRDPVPAELGQAEDMAGDGANRIGDARRYAGFVNELRDDCLGEDIEQVNQQGRCRGVGSRQGGRQGGEEQGDIDPRLAELCGSSEDGNDLLKLC